MLRLTGSGITRRHCVSAVTKAVKTVPSVEDAVDLEHGEVTVHGSAEERTVRRRSPRKITRPMRRRPA